MFADGKLINKNVGSLDVDVINRLKNFKGESLFKRAAMNMLVKMATSKEVEELRQQF